MLEEEKDEDAYRCFRDRLAGEGLCSGTIDIFRGIIYDHYRSQGRGMPWRSTRDPYRILVSEIMLQQTQVERVLDKYRIFTEACPDFPALAGKSLADVLSLWQGLGYNRRAKALLDASRIVVERYGGRLPESTEMLETLPGIGRATAGAVCAFAFNRPAVFMETNIRRVFLYFFFAGREAVPDREVYPLVAETLDTRRPRQWYYALMDYGAMLKKRVPNPNRRSAHYQRQTPFEGSDRQVRSEVLRLLLKERCMDEEGLFGRIGDDVKRVKNIVRRLRREGLVVREGKYLRIA